jgi:1-acyl-sn-glycerol-3-phosphate acyltransferase
MARSTVVAKATNAVVLIFVWLVLIAFSLVLSVLAYLPKAFTGRYYHILSRLWCRLYVRALDVDLHLICKNTKPMPQQYILVANHPSALEDFGVPALFDIYPLAKEGVRHWFFLGRVAQSAGTIFVKRNDSLSRKLAMESLFAAVKAGKNLVIFPEGGCKGRRIYKRFHSGAFDISMQTGVPILPVFLHYFDEDAFEWAGQTVLQKLWQIFNAGDNRVNYYVHDAIYPDGFDDKEVFAQHVHSQYLEWEKEYIK